MYNTQILTADDFDPYQFGLDVQRYADQASDSQFALSCFGSMMPSLPDKIVNIVDALATSTGFELSEDKKIVVPTSPAARYDDLTTFSTEAFESGALSLMLEGSMRGLKGSGAEYRRCHEKRMLAGYVIGSEIAENTGVTPWVFGQEVLSLSLPQLTAVFDVYHPDYTSKLNNLEQVLEDKEAANHYRFAASAAIFVLSSSLARIGAYRSDVIAVSKRIRKNMIKLAALNAERITSSALYTPKNPLLQRRSRSWPNNRGSRFSFFRLCDAQRHGTFCRTRYIVPFIYSSLDSQLEKALA